MTRAVAEEGCWPSSASSADRSGSARGVEGAETEAGEGVGKGAGEGEGEED
jgi:hypothetical protein